MSVSLASANSPTARLRIYLNAGRLWRWHIWLIKAISDRFPAFEICLIDSGPPLPRAITILMMLERALFGLSGEHACDVLDKSMLSTINPKPIETTDGNEIVLNLSGRALPEGVRKKLHQRVLCPLFDGVPTDDYLISALLEKHVPLLTICDVNQPGQIWPALPAVENHRILTRALDNMFSTLLRLCIKALVHANSSADLPNIQPSLTTQKRSILRSVLSFETKVLASKAATKLTNLCSRPPSWFVSWRWTLDDRVHLTRRLPGTGYHRLRDDGRRFYADPFVINFEGQHHLFIEEFDYALGRGVISTTVISHNGVPPNTPRVILERPYHLSFPFVFAHAGQIWMIPESSAARTVELYRARSFPTQWVLEATLLNDVSVADAVVFVHDRNWWMLASTVERQSSSWDALSIFHSHDLVGPWTPHRLNPVLIDSRAARPAGDVFRCAGKLWRPAQDCSEGYGAAITLCSIDRIDTETFEQSPAAALKPKPGWHSRRIHTLNWADGLEVIDGSDRI